VWNYWIIYPFIGWVLLTAAGGCFAYLRKPISESEIRREIERQGGTLTPPPDAAAAIKDRRI
jgi:hypothetical protein